MFLTTSPTECLSIIQSLLIMTPLLSPFLELSNLEAESSDSIIFEGEFDPYQGFLNPAIFANSSTEEYIDTARTFVDQTSPYLTTNIFQVTDATPELSPAFSSISDGFQSNLDTPLLFSTDNLSPKHPHANTLSWSAHQNEQPPWCGIPEISVTDSSAYSQCFEPNVDHHLPSPINPSNWDALPCIDTEALTCQSVLFSDNQSPNDLSSPTSEVSIDIQGTRKNTLSSSTRYSPYSPYTPLNSDLDLSPLARKMRRLALSDTGVADQSTSTCLPIPSSPGDRVVKLAVATDAVKRASANRRKRVANFFCTLCGQTFTAKHNLQYHQKSHRNQKDHKCEDCGKEFTAKHDLLRHLRNMEKKDTH